MVAPVVETIRIRGCPNLRWLPAIRGREAGMRMPTVEVEKDVWDALEWDGLDAGHHPSLYEKPLHSRYYKQSRLLRRTVLRYACTAHMFIHISYIYKMKSINIKVAYYTVCLSLLLTHDSGLHAQQVKSCSSCAHPAAAVDTSVTQVVALFVRCCDGSCKAAIGSSGWLLHRRFAVCDLVLK
jgi:hypothetical protein